MIYLLSHDKIQPYNFSNIQREKQTGNLQVNTFLRSVQLVYLQIICLSRQRS